MTREGITNRELDDHEITHMVMESLSQDARVPVSKVRVTVENGDVTLTGFVDCIGEKSAAEEDAGRIPGIAQVLNFIAVKPGRSVDDREIAEAVMKALIDDGRVLAGNFEVMSKNSIVTLRGEAVTEIEKRAALDDANSTYGVQQVIDEVVVLPVQHVTDHMLEEQVHQELSRAPGINERLIRAHVEDGIVRLSGTVEFAQQVADVERVATDIPGVRGVENRLSVSRAA